jgi:hypothetical protein
LRPRDLPVLLARRLLPILVGIVSTASAAFAASASPSLLERLPLAFAANHGQHDPRVQFALRGRGHAVFLTGDETVMVFAPPEALDAARPRRAGTRLRPVGEPSVLRMRFVGGNPRPAAAGVEPLPGSLNDFHGPDPTRWRTGLPQYARVRYREVYPGIDVLYYGNDRRLAYDLLVAPHADPARVALAFEGAEGLALDGDGNLIVLVGGRAIRQLAPVAYQETDGGRRPVAARFVLDGAGRVAFAVGAYDRARPLVIDPTLTWATFVGGSGDDIANGVASGLAVGSDGSMYVAGATTSLDFPERGGTGATVLFDVFVVKLNATGTAFGYSTVLGGSQDDLAFGIAVDAAGNAYVAGETASSDFPTLNSLQPFRGGDVFGTDAFVLKLGPTGSLVYSTFYGGTGDDSAAAIAVAPTGGGGAAEAFITGYTTSTDFPVVRAFQRGFGGAGPGTLLPGDAFVVKLSARGSAVYATYLGGSDDDAGTGIAADGGGNAYVTGITASTDFPVVGAFQAEHAGPAFTYDLFVAKLNARGSALLYSTYLGGTDDELGGAITVNAAGNALVTGTTGSFDFPTADPLQAANAGSLDVILALLAPTGASLVFSTYLGGENADYGLGVGLDGTGHPFVAGLTTSATFPTRLPLRASRGGSSDAYVARLTPNGSALVYSTYFGGGNDDFANALAVDPAGFAYIAGGTAGGTVGDPFPVTPGAARTTYGGGFFDAFVAKIDPIGVPVPPNQPPDCSGARPSVDVIWPPNRKQVFVSILGVTDPDGDPVTITITQVLQDEPTIGKGDRNTPVDGGGGTDTAWVRAERSATGDGRVYEIRFLASDGRGGACTGSVKVAVPHDQHKPAVDSGVRYDSMTGAPAI